MCRCHILSSNTLQPTFVCLFVFKNHFRDLNFQVETSVALAAIGLLRRTYLRKIIESLAMICIIFHVFKNKFPIGPLGRSVAEITILLLQVSLQRWHNSKGSKVSSFATILLFLHWAFNTLFPLDLQLCALVPMYVPIITFSVVLCSP